MTERLHFHFSHSCTGEGNGNPLQYSCLENPMDRGAWWAAVYGVTQSQTRLKWLSSLAAAPRHSLRVNSEVLWALQALIPQLKAIFITIPLRHWVEKRKGTPGLQAANPIRWFRCHLGAGQKQDPVMFSFNQGKSANKNVSYFYKTTFKYSFSNILKCVFLGRVHTAWQQVS